MFLTSRRANTNLKVNMSSSNTTRIFKNGFLNFRRNFWLSTAATVVMAVTIFIITALIVLTALTNAALTNIREKVDISIFFTLDTSENTITQIKKQVELLPEVKEITYIPPTFAREKFLELHQNEPLLIEAVEQFTDAENPFPASFAVKVRDLNDYPTIISLFEEEKFDPFVKKITDKREIVNRLNQITTGVQNLGLLSAAIFSIITVLVMYNTIRLTIYNRRAEIEIMRLVGASNSYIRGPFVIEGIFYGIAGAVITAAITFPLILSFTPRINEFIGINFGGITALGFNIWLLLIPQFLVGIILGAFSSLVTIRRYLKI